MAGQYVEALKFNKTLMRLSRIYSLDLRAIGVIKEGLKLRGVPVETYVRQPAGKAPDLAVLALKKLLSLNN